MMKNYDTDKNMTTMTTTVMEKTMTRLRKNDDNNESKQQPQKRLQKQ